MSNAVAAQFKLQRSDIAALNQRLDDQSAAHAKATKIHDKTFTQLQATVAALETTIVRLEMAPSQPVHHHMPSPMPTRIHSRSRSPADSGNKRARSVAAFEATAFVTMGPVRMAGGSIPGEIFQCYMDATLPHYALPESGNYDVILDPIQFGFLRIRTIIPGDAHALALAWSKGANTAIKMVGHDTGNVPTVDAGGSASGYRVRGANWNGSGNGSGSGTYRRSGRK